MHHPIIIFYTNAEVVELNPSIRRTFMNDARTYNISYAYFLIDSGADVTSLLEIRTVSFFSGVQSMRTSEGDCA